MSTIEPASPVPDQPTWGARVADAFHAAGLGEVLFPTPSVRDSDTLRLFVEMCGRHGHTATDAVHARSALARHLGVPEERLTVQLVPDKWRVELTVRDAETTQ